MRSRVCAAIIRDNQILMVRHEHQEQSYWTLPGGGVESGENIEQAVIREVLEETHLHIEVVQFLFEEPYASGTTYCYLATVDEISEARLGNDPEEKDLHPRDRMLQEVDWHSLESMKNDRQVSKVIEYFSKNGDQAV